MPGETGDVDAEAHALPAAAAPYAAANCTAWSRSVAATRMESATVDALRAPVSWTHSTTDRRAWPGPASCRCACWMATQCASGREGPAWPKGAPASGAAKPSVGGKLERPDELLPALLRQVQAAPRLSKQKVGACLP